MLLDVVNALFYFYALLFTGTLIALFIGIRLLYVAIQRKDGELMRKAKFVLLFAVIALVCIAIVSFFCYREITYRLIDCQSNWPIIL